MNTPIESLIVGTTTFLIGTNIHNVQLWAAAVLSAALASSY